MANSRFEIVTTSAGAKSIRNRELNEIMHNPVGPWKEANALYIEQSSLATRLAESAEGDEFVIYDVGLGAAANALAALHCAKMFATTRVKIVSFERDLELTHFALTHAVEFAHFAGWESALSELLQTGRWDGGHIVWELRPGDFLVRVDEEVERPHLVFYDPYSHKVNREMWTSACFRKLRARCREDSQMGTLLFTYSQSTPVRVALLEAGFFVGVGSATGLKEETTQAATRLEDLRHPLGTEWLKRWTKSHAKFPFGHDLRRESMIESMVLQHLQFRKTGEFGGGK